MILNSDVRNVKKVKCGKINISRRGTKGNLLQNYEIFKVPQPNDSHLQYFIISIVMSSRVITDSSKTVSCEHDSITQFLRSRTVSVMQEIYAESSALKRLIE